MVIDFIFGMLEEERFVCPPDSSHRQLLQDGGQFADTFTLNLA